MFSGSSGPVQSTDRLSSKVVQEEDKKALESLAASIIKEKQPFERLEMTKEELLEMFKYSKYKEYFINQRVPDGTTSTVYRCGPLIDLCRGPHVPHTGNIKAFSVLKVRCRPLSLTQLAMWFIDILTCKMVELGRLLARQQLQRVCPANFRCLIPRQEATRGVQDLP